MLNSTETTSMSTIVPVAPHSDISSEEQEEYTTFVIPMPKHITFGHVTLTNDQEEFLQGFDTGMQCYCEIDYEKQQMTAKALMHDLREAILDEEISLVWRLGFMAGEIAGMLNPDIARTESETSYLEVLTRKCQVLYPGPGQVSTHLQAIHQATGLDLFDVVVASSSPLPR